MKTVKYRVSLGYAKLNDDSLIAFATGIHTHLFPLAVYPTPPVAAAELMASITAFTAAKVAQASGGKAATATKNECRETVSNQLRDLAYYVQVACGNDLALLLESGFDSASLNRAQVQLDKPVITRIQPGLSGEALVTVTPDRNARSYEIRVAEVDETNTPGPFRPAVVRPSSRNMTVDALIPGKLCVFQVRAVGGLTGFSNWSDAVVQRAA